MKIVRKTRDEDRILTQLAQREDRRVRTQARDLRKTHKANTQRDNISWCHALEYAQKGAR